MHKETHTAVMVNCWNEKLEVVVIENKPSEFKKLTENPVFLDKGGEVWELGYDYDLKDRITHVSDCLGPVFQYEYDKNDRLETERYPQAEENFGKFHCFTYGYDSYGNVLTRKDGEGTVLEENRYLTNGSLAFKRTADGNEITYTYGVHGQETKIHTARSKKAGMAAQAYTYDANGRITGVVDGNQN